MCHQRSGRDGEREEIDAPAIRTFSQQIASGVEPSVRDERDAIAHWLEGQAFGCGPETRGALRDLAARIRRGGVSVMDEGSVTMADRCYRSGCEEPPTYRALLVNEQGRLYCEGHAIDSTDFWLRLGFDAPAFERLGDGQRVRWQPTSEAQRLIDLELMARE